MSNDVISNNELSIANRFEGGRVVAWDVVDENDEVVATFDSRGGYTRSDAERFIDEDNDQMKCRSCGLVTCSPYCGLNERV